MLDMQLEHAIENRNVELTKEIWDENKASFHSFK